MNLFKKNPKTSSKPVDTVIYERGQKTTSELIEEIHESFFTEVDSLLASAKIANSLDTDKQALIDKCLRLKALGFTSTKEVKEAEKEIERLDALKEDNDKKQSLIEAINYFSMKYPNYKFITEDSVKKICAKYGLIYGEIGRYIGTVPDKNLKHIEEFNVFEEDQIRISYTGYISSFLGSEVRLDIKYKSQKEHLEKELKLLNEIKASDPAGTLMYKSHFFEIDLYRQINANARGRSVDMLCPLEIAAPAKDFDTNGMEVKDFKLSKIEIPDPVVLKPVIFNHQKHYLIVTAWGLESQDELVVNERNN